MVLVLIIAGRMAISAWLPLMEFSEARYAEIARKIIDHHDWVTLWFHEGEPFWGKPPMAFWSVALSYLLLGVNEFSARIPSLLFTLATVAILFFWVRRHIGPREARGAVLVYLGSWLVLDTAGAVITDPLLTFATTLVMVSFWEAVAGERARYAWLVWFGLGIGLLAKGPLALVLCGLASGLWVLIYGRWRAFFANIRWLAGPLLMFVIAVPWYYLAEQRTPGFLDYFIVGEHFERYLESKWAGDLYGSVKNRPIGTIWIFFLVATLPWSLFFTPRSFKRGNRHAVTEIYRKNPPLYGYLACWTLVPLVFFTPARNVIITYALPAMPAFSILLSRSAEALVLRRKHLVTLATAGTLLFFGGTVLAYYLYFAHHRYNQKPMVEKYLALNRSNPGKLVYTGKPRFSVIFYTRGKAEFTSDTGSYLDSGRTVYVGVRDRWLEGQKRQFGDRCTMELHRNDYSLWYCPATGNRKR